MYMLRAGSPPPPCGAVWVRGVWLFHCGRAEPSCLSPLQCSQEGARECFWGDRPCAEWVLGTQISAVSMWPR